MAISLLFSYHAIHTHRLFPDLACAGKALSLPACFCFKNVSVSKAVAAAKSGQGGKKGKVKAEGIQSRLGIRSTAAAEFRCLF